MSHAVKGTKKKIDIKNQIHLLMTDIYYNLFVWCIFIVRLYCLHNKMLNHFNATRFALFFYSEKCIPT